MPFQVLSHPIQPPLLGGSCIEKLCYWGVCLFSGVVPSWPLFIYFHRMIDDLVNNPYLFSEMSR